MKLAFILDPLEGLKAYKDSSVAMMRVASRRGHEVWAIQREALTWRDGSVCARARRLEVGACSQNVDGASVTFDRSVVVARVASPDVMKMFAAAERCAVFVGDVSRMKTLTAMRLPLATRSAMSSLQMSAPAGIETDRSPPNVTAVSLPASVCVPPRLFATRTRSK